MKCKRCKEVKGIVYWNHKLPRVCLQCFEELKEGIEKSKFKNIKIN